MTDRADDEPEHDRADAESGPTPDGESRGESGRELSSESTRESIGEPGDASDGDTDSDAGGWADAESGVVYAHFRMELPPETWIAAVSQEFPSATFRLLAGIRTGETATELGEALTSEPAAVERAMAAHSAIERVERLERTDDRLLTKYETTDTDLYGFVAASSVPLEFPITVRDGWYELRFTGSRDGFDRLTATLDASPLASRLVSKLSTRQPEGVLTDRQREVLGTALRHGYLDVPRNCTLAELADRLDADTSTVSGVLRRGQARLAAWFFADSRRRP